LTDRRKNKTRSRLDLYFSVLDYWILVPVLLVATIGLFVLNRVLSSGYDGNGHTMFIKQAGAVMSGVMIAMILGALETPFLKIIAFIVYGISVLLLVFVLVDSYSLVETTGADSWLRIPLIGSFQPSELAKVGMIMLSSYFLADIKSGKISKIRGLLIVGAIFAIPLELIRRQPDLGTILVIMFILFSMLYVYGLPYKYILLASSGGIALLPVIWAFILKPHQKNRILTFLYPGFSPSQAFHIEQAKIAIRAGGITGSNLDNTITVPVKESDFIYTAVAEQLGFIGTTVLVLLIFTYIVRSLILSSGTTDPALKYMSAGIAVMFGIHSVENLGMCVGIMPITGIPLPFVSLGGSSMIVNFFALGILLCISIEQNMTRKLGSFEFLD